jgi:hypothetical protein
MWNRRQFLVRGAAVSLALAPCRRALSAPVPKRKEDEAGKLITPELRKVIEAGLKKLGAGQHEDGSFGLVQSQKTVRAAGVRCVE